YRLSTGSAPFHCTNSRALYRSLEHDQPRPPEQLNQLLPPAFSALVLRLLAKKPADRPASAEEVIREIDAITSGSARPRATLRRWRKVVVAGIAAFGLILIAAVGYNAAPTIYRLVTDRGELVIETNDPGVEVIIKDRTGKVVDRTGKREILLKAGEY